ncbi:hypothetical protein J2Z60_001910 [Lactobacillus colini]|uniref:S-layer protein C-terminal domain-containing protein n=1 Tax=Lactobacillus colini TaxID=1819254 RepID=A0ABS4MG99_9LACO|nr:SLAP domain-containing protein [Lactobacillus colini]MBP2058721.1 hypothetical protein [Lactobacillus colini]
MKKIKIISVTAAALLAIAPSIVNTFSVNAESTTNSQVLSQVTDQSTTKAKNATNIVAKFTLNKKEENINPDGQYFQVDEGSNFNPFDFKLSNGSEVKISDESDKVTVDSNTVDTSKSGSTGEVKLTTNDKNGTTSTITYTVFVKPSASELFQLNLKDRDWVNGLGDIDIFYQGTKYSINNQLKYEYNQFYSAVSYKYYPNGAPGNSLLWIPTKYLANSKDSKPNLVKKTVMHKALGYGVSGDTTKKLYSAYSTIYVKDNVVNIDGGKYYESGKFYQVYNANGTYTNYYIKVGNVDGTKRTLKHNAYVYATSKRRSDRTVLNKGTEVVTYGSSYKFKNSKRYYRIEGATKSNKRYVKVANFE